MADASEITVAVESVIHDALRDAVQAIFDQHGIMVESATFSWWEWDMSSVGKSERRCSTTSVYSVKPQ